MNKLLCNHQFNFNKLLMSNPPQVRCVNCNISAYINDAKEYMKLDEIKSESIKDRKDLWKSVVLSTISSGQCTGTVSSVYSNFAVSVADAVLEEFDKKFN